MRIGTPRIAPVDAGQADADQKDLLESLASGGRPSLNVFKTFARFPDAARAFLAWGGYILSPRNALDARRRELVILRTGFNCRSGYEWTQHVPIGQRAGLTDEEIARVKMGPGDPAWDALDRASLQACDELHADQYVQPTTWSALEPLGDKGRMDLVMTVGQYTQVSMFLNSLGVQLDEGQTLDPDLDHR